LHLWGAELRALRDRYGLSLAELGAAVFYDASHLGKFERAERVPPRRVAQMCDRQLGDTGVLVRMWEAIRATGSSRVDEADRSVHEANSDQDGANPGGGLAGTVEDPSVWYEEEDTVSLPVLHDGKVIFVAVSRRALLALAGTTVALTAVGVPLTATPAAASSPTPLPAAPDMNPIEHLREIRRVLIDNDNLFGPRVVIPTVEQQIKVMQHLRGTIDGGDRRRLVQLQASYAEFAGWLYEDVGNFTAAQYWMDRALEWSHASHDPDLITYILARKAQLAGDMSDPTQVVDVGQAAEQMARPGTRLAAIAATYTAHGHALRRDATASAAGYDRAHHLIDSTDLDPTSAWGIWLDHAYVEVHRARSLAVLGRHHQDGHLGSSTGNTLMRQAAEGFATAITRLPVGYHRDRGVYLARQAAAHAGAREPEYAAEIATRALTVGTQTGSARILTELAQVDQDLSAWRSLPPVTAFHDALAGGGR
jgi:transcriptional regulator with XRE-family HTH domain